MKTDKHISLKQLIFDNKFYLLLGLVLLVFNKAATMIIPYTSKPLIDEVIKNGNVILLKKIILIIVVALIIQAITSFALVQILGVKAQKKIAEIRTIFFNKLTYLPLSYFKNSRTGELVSRTLDDFESIRIYLGAGFVQLVGGVISVIFALGLMFSLNIQLSLYTLIPVGIFCLIIYIIYKQQKPAFKKRKQIRANLSANLTETYRNIKVIKGFNSNDYTTNILKKGFYNLYLSIKTTLTSSNLLISLGVIFIGLTSVIIMWFGGNMAINKTITIGELTTFTIYLAFLIAPIYQITKISSQFVDAKASIERINETLIVNNEETNESGKRVNLNGNFSLKNISFKYDSKNILNNISLEIKPKTITAIAGKSGAGKTTLIDLIAGFHSTYSGSIEVEKENLKNLNLNHYRNQLGFVFQETFLFDGTIKENILIAKPNASEQEVNAALEKANVLEFLNQQPNGVNTLIGENGSKLSEGQKQRIAIARAFLADPKVLILDEATSSLDTHNQNQITSSIEKLMQNRTIIIVAHQLDTIKNADQIILLDKGEICEIGTHDELFNLKGKYFSLYGS